MRTIRGLQITSLVVLSPVLLILVSLVTILIYSIYSQIYNLISTQPMETTTTLVIPHQHYKRIYRIPLLKRMRTKALFSPWTWCIIAFLCVYAMYKKKQPNNAIEHVEQETIKKTHNKKAKRRKLNKKLNSTKKRSRSISISSTELNVNNQVKTKVMPIKEESIKDEKEWTNVCEKSKKKVIITQDVQREKEEDCSCKKTIDLNLISPASTPIHSEDEEEIKKNWYSPFMTGLDLDIIPKYSHKENDIIFTVHHFNNIPTSFHNTIQLLENHPFIPSSVHNIHSHKNVFGSIGDQRKKSLYLP